MTTQRSLEDLMLSQLTPTFIEQLPKAPMCSKCFVYKITDGDTLKAVYLHGGVVPTKITLRVEGIDTPEKRGSSDLEKDAANRVKMYAASLLSQKIVNVCFKKWGKWGGRIITTVTLPSGEDYSEHLVNKGYAKRYDGGKKEKWTDSELTHITNDLFVKIE